MGFVNFNRHSAVALNLVAPHDDRCWALRSCCYSLASLVRCGIDTNELVTTIADAVPAEVKRREWGKLVIVTVFTNR